MFDVVLLELCPFFSYYSANVYKIAIKASKSVDKMACCSCFSGVIVNTL